MEMLQGVWKQHLRPRAVVGYGVKIFLPSPLNYVTRSPGSVSNMLLQLFLTPVRVRMPSYRVFSRGVTVAMLVFPINPSGTELYSYANVFFCFDTEYISAKCRKQKYFIYKVEIK